MPWEAAWGVREGFLQEGMSEEKSLRLSGNYPGDKGIRGEEMLPEGTARIKVIGHETTWEALRFIST